MKLHDIAMIIRRQCAVISLAILFLFVLSVNVYFICVIVEESPSSRIGASSHKTSLPAQAVSKPRTHKELKTIGDTPVAKYSKKTIVHRNATLEATQKIYSKLAALSSKYYDLAVSMSQSLVKQLSDDLKSNVGISTNLWPVANKWVGSREIFPESAPELGSLLRTLCSTKIIRAENANRGTQLKLLLTLEGGQKVIFKPEWYSREEVIDGPVYAGKDRHNAEVAAFHLATLLGLRRSPPAVGRRLNLRREVMAVATDNLLDTFYQEGNNTCFYGVCYYCSPQDPVCAKKDYMEGAVIMWLPDVFKLKKYRNPWQRTYKNDAVARWEMDTRYCNKVKVSKLYNPQSGPRLLDLIDSAIFDFLIDNGDRHHYEVFENHSDSIVVLLDNGKSFGNPKQDHVDILAPLYQCCLVRQSTWSRLQMYSGGMLSNSLEQLLAHSHITPVLAPSHLQALDRRLLSVFAAVEVCIDERGAGSGIGRAVCQLLARDGARVVAADRNGEAARQTLDLIPDNGLNHLSLDVDVSQQASVSDAIAKVVKHYAQPPTIVINSAGITRDTFLLKMDENTFQSVIDVNLKGTFFVTQSAAKAMIDAGIQGGSFVNLASIVGKTGNIGQCNYAASKAGVEAFTKTAAKEFGKFGIRCNCVVPGFIKSPMTDVIPEKLKDAFRASIASGRFGTTEEVAEVIVFLASNKSMFVNGASVDVNGG